jgi:hypothetical protein
VADGREWRRKKKKKNINEQFDMTHDPNIKTYTAIQHA